MIRRHLLPRLFERRRRHRGARRRDPPSAPRSSRWRRRRSRWRSSTPSCAPRASRSASTSEPFAPRSTAESRSASTRTSGRAPRRSSTATSRRATAASSSRSSPATTSSRSVPCANASATSCFQVDANAAYTLDDAPQLAKLDEFDLLLIEQPLAGGRHPRTCRAGDASSARRSASTSRSPRRASAEDAIALGACRIVNIKAGRVGGYLEARRVHDVCEAHGVPVWCGGMLETGLGRAANVALAALPNFTLPGDTSASGPLLRTRTSPSPSSSATAGSTFRRVRGSA